ncbi:MAG: hypothetical protein V4671_17385, partial [Armatimonadota bacterium]
MPETVPLTSELLASLHLEELVLPDSLQVGKRLHQQGLVRLTARSATTAHFAVRETANSRPHVTLLRANPPRNGTGVSVTVDCDCEIFEKGDVCPH